MGNERKQINEIIIFLDETVSKLAFLFMLLCLV